MHPHAIRVWPGDARADHHAPALIVCGRWSCATATPPASYPQLSYTVGTVPTYARHECDFPCQTGAGWGQFWTAFGREAVFGVRQIGGCASRLGTSTEGV